MQNRDWLISRAVHYAPVLIAAGLTYFVVFFALIVLGVEANKTVHWALSLALVMALAILFLKMVLRPLKPE
ncbi:hypothetical protein [Alteromonas lipolytica]|uniref:Uncharacterized protein n=1 Tax=Alteromonas lipolytica TaxID=1856405 RepID=A0A1E8FAG6_9ALTE|nr:hypothetical protein [Alteromonas lipolytica]OFI32776.1 hypothetical protein BFC17_06395 [Alteromonas lipolytica]GGF73132.1 hypothetical protein GCM10011338_26650 [Alteromonas lipolytica]